MVTIALEKGAQLKTTHGLLGHITIATTADIVSIEMREEVVNKIDGLFGRS